MKKLLSSVLLALTTGSVAHAAGFSIDSQSGRAVGMGTAMAGFVDDASAVFYNPAGIVQGEGLKLQLGITPIIAKPAVTYAGGPTTSTETRISPPPHLYATYGVTRDLSVGFGIFTPFGSNTAWPGELGQPSWPGQFESMGSELATYYFNPQAGYRLHDRVRVAAGVQVVRATVRLLRNQNFLDNIVGVEMGGGAWGVGANAGIQVDVLPRKLTAGLSYRSAVKLGFKGSVDFSNVPPEFAPVLFDRDIQTDITMPHALSLGAGYRLTDRVLLAAQVDWFDHSTISAIDIQEADGTTLNSTRKNWEDRFTAHIGAEWATTDALTLRAGFVYDPTPSVTETAKADVPDSNRIRPSIGAGYKLGQFTGDLGYSYVFLTDLEARGGSEPSVINGHAHVLSATVGFQM